MEDIYRYVIDNDIVRVMKNGTIYKFYKRKNKFQKAPQHGASRDRKYKYITVEFNGKQYYLYVHRLVALMYIPNPENKPEVNHIDGKPENNKVDNLEWATRSENMQHAHDTGLIDLCVNGGECIYCNNMTQNKNRICPKCSYKFKLAEEKTQRTNEIRKELELIDIRALTLREQEIVYQRYLGFTYEEIGEQYNLSRQRIEQIINVAKLKTLQSKTYPVLEYYLLRNDVNQKEMAAKINMGISTLSNKLSGKSEIKLMEAIAIKNFLEVELPLEELFKVAI